jgi:HD-GYP domain-containing protein (c-di-GMP phosphodiesterase class II)
MTSNTTIEVSVNDLQPGMFVSDLDRPWLETPYAIQGILIQSQHDIDKLKRYCAHVYVDIDRSEPFVAQQHLPNAGTSTGSTASSARQSAAQQHPPPADSRISPSAANRHQPPVTSAGNESLDVLKRVKIYTDTCTAEQEIPAAVKAYNIASTLFSDISVNLEHDIKIDMHKAHEVVDTLCESIIRNPDAALLLARLKTTGKELYDNAIKTSVHLLAFGRHLGLPRQELSILGLGGLLMDVGKLRLPKAIQNKRNMALTPDERKLTKRHIAYGEEIVAQLSDVPEEVTKILLQHHERENGNGYPFGLYANQLHAYARMAAIVDCYEELTWGDSGMPGMKPFHALKELKENAQNGLNYSLVEQFAQCVGMFPVGSLVELNTGEIAIVLTHNRTQRFLPSIMIICDAQKKPYSTPLTLDLRTAGTNPAGVQYAIVNDLPQGAYGIDPQQYYL